MKKYISSTAICAAESDEAFDTTLKDTKDDFDYIMMGAETLARRDSSAKNEAMSVVSELRVTLNDYISRIAELIGE